MPTHNFASCIGEGSVAIVHIDFRTISWGGPNEDDSNNVWQVEDGGNDPGEIVLQDFGTVGTPINGFPAPPSIGPGANPYKFVFWNATSGVNALDGYPSTGPNLNIELDPGNETVG